MTNVYKSNARFVFELIQNAEDNNYSRATSNNAAPYIKFTVHPEKIVIDSNEDGFSTDNVKAICKVGRSTKAGAGAQQYIGEKGIGFKSVFLVASKVHIQSGPFSFFFERPPAKQGIEPRSQTGMYMITPIWDPPKRTLPDPLTRMELTLKQRVDYPGLLKQFDALPDTFLLFLNKLRTITIDRVATAGRTAETTTFSSTVDEPSGRATLTKVQRQGSEQPKPSLKHYQITRKVLRDLAPDEQRDYSTAEVVLAFEVQLNSDSIIPVICPQQVHAYLPIGYFGFSVSQCEVRCMRD